MPTVVTSVQDRDFGAVVTFGLGEVAARLLADDAYRLRSAHSGRRRRAGPRAPRRPLLFGEHGYPPVAVGALEDLLCRIGRLADAHPQVAALRLDPVLVGEHGVHVLGARAVLKAVTGPRPDVGPRRLPS